jgi:hypothetical protein
LCLDSRSGGIGLLRKPGFKARFVGDMDGSGGLRIVRLDQIVVTHNPFDSRYSKRTGDISERLCIFLICITSHNRPARRAGATIRNPKS